MYPRPFSLIILFHSATKNTDFDIFQIAAAAFVGERHPHFVQVLLLKKISPKARLWSPNTLTFVISGLLQDRTTAATW